MQSANSIHKVISAPEFVKDNSGIFAAGKQRRSPSNGLLHPL